MTKLKDHGLMSSFVYSGLPNDAKKMGETPFSLAFRTKVVIPIEIEIPLARVANYDEQTNPKR